MNLHVYTPIDPDAAACWEGLSAIYKRIETRFLSVGDNLENLGLRLGELAGPISTLTSLSEENWSEISAKTDQLKKMQRETGFVFTDFREGISMMLRTASSLGDQVWQVKRIIATMKIVSLNARVTASAISQGATGLEVFTSTAGQLVGEAEITITDMMELVSRILKRMTNEFQTCLSRGLVDVESINEHLNRLSQIIDQILADDGSQTGFGAALGQGVDDLRTALGSTTMSMLAGDRARQRLEHVEEIAKLAEDVGSPTISGLARRQYLDTAASFGDDVRTIEQHFVTTLQLAEALAQPAGTKPEAVGDNGQQIAKTVEDIRARIHSLQATRQHLLNYAQQTEADFKNLSDGLTKIHSLETQMKFVGTNAIIACGRLGSEGLALKEVANQLSDFTSEISRDLKGVGDVLVSLSADAEVLTGPMTQQFADVNAQMDGASAAVLERLQAIFKTSENLSHSIAEVAQEVRGRLGGDLSGVRGLTRDLTRFANGLGAIALAEAFPPADILNGAVFDIYSIDQERDLHRRFCAELGIAGPEETPDVVVAQTADDIFF